MRKKKLNLSIDPEIIKAAKLKAIREDTSVSAVVEQFLREWVKEEPTEEEEKTPS